MSVSFNALHRVVRVVIELVKHHLIHLVINWHRLLSWEEALRTLVFLLLKPRMSSDFWNTITLFWISIQNFWYEMSTVLRKELWNFIVPGKNLFVQVWSFRVFKRQESADHSVKDNSTAPDVRFEPKVLFASDHFRRCIAWRATSRLELLTAASCVHVTEAEINNFQSFVEVQQQVLRLQVPVANAWLVNVLDARH